MSGQDGNRGYIIQSVVALLESLNHSDWDTLTIEPNHASDKIDISWSGASATKACQVKSSINQINQSDAKKWAVELEEQSTADDLTLILVGPCSLSVARMGTYGKVTIPCPKNLDFTELLGFAAHLLARFLDKEKINVQSPNHRELMIRALITELSIFASSGSPITRHDFIELLKTWIKDVVAPTNLRWELVDFTHQRGIENAIAGKRLGPGDVEQCPEFTICEHVVAELNRSHWYSIVGQRGCGKSITAWQAAKKFHDVGYSIWRPHYNAEADQLLKSLPSSQLSLLVVDDAQQFGAGFIERLSEHSCETLKVLVTSTLAEIVSSNPSCISPTAGIDELKTAILQRHAEILPIIQKFDNRVSNSFLDVPFEQRVNDCARQKTPWEFFWVLRGGWQTARNEYESLKQIPNANVLVSVISLRQISSCDAGISRNQLFQISNELGFTDDEVDKAISHLVAIGLVLISDDIFRTKHISYAYSIAEESLHKDNDVTWSYMIDTIVATLLDVDTSLKGVYWLLNAIRMTDMICFGQQTKLCSILEPLMSRCRNEWEQSEWAVGCASCLFGFFGLSLKEILVDEELLLIWFTAGSGMIARFSGNIANDLINNSDIKDKAETIDVAKSLFEKVDLTRLIELSNEIKLENFYSFGYLLNRLAFYHPSWSKPFLSQLNWPRILRIILHADVQNSYAVDKLVGALSLLSRSQDAQSDTFKYIEDIIPFIVKATNENPINTIESMHDVFWSCLGFAPTFLRGVHPDKRQFQIVRSVVAQLNPRNFALAMGNIISRDMETLARSLSIIREVDAEFISKIASLVPEKDFHIAAKSDWRTQSGELRCLLRFFCIGKDFQPARNWVTCNEENIEGLLEPLFAGIAPQVAINFHKAGKRVSLIGHNQQRWNETVMAIVEIGDLDKNICIEIIMEQFDVLEGALYNLTPDSPKYIILFFRLLNELSDELFSNFVHKLDMNDPRAIKTIDQLVKSQSKTRADYTKLARVARQIGGEIGAVGDNLLMRLEETSPT